MSKVVEKIRKLSNLELLQKNWNRIGYISKLHDKSDKLRYEQSYRISLQNSFACSKNEQDEKDIITKIRESFIILESIKNE